MTLPILLSSMFFKTWTQAELYFDCCEWRIASLARHDLLMRWHRAVTTAPSSALTQFSIEFRVFEYEPSGKNPSLASKNLLCLLMLSNISSIWNVSDEETSDMYFYWTFEPSIDDVSASNPNSLTNILWKKADEIGSYPPRKKNPKEIKCNITNFPSNVDINSAAESTNFFFVCVGQDWITGPSSVFPLYIQRKPLN